MAGDEYGTAEVAARLGHATRCLEDVQDRMAAAMKRAEYWREEYAGHGLPGLGRGCEQIRAAAETLHGQASTLLREIGQHNATATTVTDTTEPDQIIATLTPCEHALQTLAAHCLAAAQRCTDLAALVAHNLDGAKPEWLTEQATAAQSAFAQARHHLDDATTLVANAIRHAQQAGTAADLVAPTPPGRDKDTRTHVPGPVHGKWAGHGESSLIPHENVGGHTIARHVGKSDAELVARGRRRASTFNDLPAAETATSSNIAANRNAISRWLAGATTKLVIRNPMSPTDGRVYDQTRRAALSPSTVKTILVRNPAMRNGYYILTSYPET